MLIDPLGRPMLIDPTAQVSIELKPHVGVTGTPLGDFREALDQWMVFCHTPQVDYPIFIGYLPFDADKKFCPYTTWNSFPTQLQGVLLTKISEQAGSVRQLGNVPIDPNSELGRRFLQTGTIPGATASTEDESEAEDDSEGVE